MKEFTIKNLQSYLSTVYPDITEEELFFKLVDGLGNLAEIISIRLGRKRGQTSDVDLGDELAELIHYVVALAAVNQIDLEEILIAKDKEFSKKQNLNYNLSQFLE